MPSDSKVRKRGRGATTSRMRDVAHRAGVSVMTVSRTLNDPDKVSAEMRRRGGAAVVENGNLTETPLDSVVSYSNFEASRAMTLHLSRIGYRHIAFVSLATRENDRALERRRGFLAALRELGRAADERLILERPPGLSA